MNLRMSDRNQDGMSMESNKYATLNDKPKREYGFTVKPSASETMRLTGNPKMLENTATKEIREFKADTSGQVKIETKEAERMKQIDDYQDWFFEHKRKASRWEMIAFEYNMQQSPEMISNAWADRMSLKTTGSTDTLFSKDKDGESVLDINFASSLPSKDKENLMDFVFPKRFGNFREAVHHTLEM